MVRQLATNRLVLATVAKLTTLLASCVAHFSMRPLDSMTCMYVPHAANAQGGRVPVERATC